MFSLRRYYGIGRLHEAYYGRHNYYKLAFGVGIAKDKTPAMTYLTSQFRGKEYTKYKRMFDHFYKMHLESSPVQEVAHEETSLSFPESI